MEAEDAEEGWACRASMAAEQVSRSARSAVSAINWAYSEGAMRMRGELLAFLAVSVRCGHGSKSSESC